MKSSIVALLLLLTISTTQVHGITPEQIAALKVRSPLPTAATLEAMAANGNTIVAVGTRGGAVKSLDGGTSWSAMQDLTRNGARQDMYGVASDGERFVTVGFYAAVTTDVNAWEWSPDSLGTLRLDIDYGQGVFVAVGRTATVAVSSNGMSWALMDLPEGTSLEAIAFGNGDFVGVGSNARIVRSADGMAWETVKEVEEGVGRLRDVSYANGLFIAAGDGGLLYISPDGITWTKPEHGSTTNLGRGVYFNDQYVMLDTLSSTQLTTDFTSLTRSQFGFSGGANDLLVVGERIVAVGREGFLATSEDGLNWTERREALSDNFSSAAFGNDTFVIADRGSRRLFSSANGAIWTQRLQHDSSFRSGLAFGGGQFAIIAGQTCLRSVDGRSWVVHDTGLSFTLGSLRYVNGRFITVGRNGELASSPDGVQWTSHDIGVDVLLQDINYENNIYVAVGQSENVYTSPDLTTWIEQPSGIEGATSFSRIEVFKSEFFLFQGLGVPAVSTDGSRWTLLDDSLRFFANATGVDPELGVYTLTGGQVIHNAPGADLSAWEYENIPVASNFLSLTSGNGVAIGVGNNGLVMSSPLEVGGYDGWTTEHFGAEASDTVSSPTANPDGDEMPNLEEYVRDLDPNLSNPWPTPTLQLGSFGPEITWEQLAGLPDVQTRVEYSTDLNTWSEEGVAFSEVGVGDGREAITGRVTGEAGTRDVLFFRMRWSLLR